MARGGSKKTRDIRRELMAVTLAAAAAGTVTPAFAASDIFAKIGDIKGESVDSKHKDEIEILSWSWGVSGPTRLSPKIPGQPVGPPQPACPLEFSIDKFVDASSPLLIANAALGKSTPSATLSVRKSDSDQADFLKITLSDVIISSVAAHASTDQTRLRETVTFAYSSATISYAPQDAKGTLGPAITATVPGSCP